MNERDLQQLAERLEGRGGARADLAARARNELKRREAIIKRKKARQR